MNINTVCNCPKCNHSGISLAAMHYKETQEWEKSGRFSGSGGAIGTFGVGVGGFSGSYSENGKIATKRANHFSQPEPYSVSIIHLILPLILILIAINALPSIIEIMSQIFPDSSSGALNNNTDGIFKIVSFFNYYIAPIYGLFIVYSIFSNIIKANKEEEHLNTTLYPEKLKRYNQLRYCENCNTIFDHKGNFEDANPIGMDKIMSISPNI